MSFSKFLNYLFIALSLLLFIAVMAALLDERHDMPMTADELMPPSMRYWLGTNDLGQDLLLRTWLATPDSLFIALGVGLTVPFIALAYALSLALSSIKIRRYFLRLVDVLLAFPSFLLAILLATYLQPGTALLILILIALEWPKEVRELYVLALSEVQRESFLQARQFGASFAYLLLHHLFPRILPNFTSVAISTARRGILHAAGLSFLGVTDPSIPTWGGMIADVIPLLYTPEAINLIIAPACALMGFMSLLTLGGYVLEKHVFFNLVGGSHD